MYMYSVCEHVGKNKEYHHDNDFIATCIALMIDIQYH